MALLCKCLQPQGRGGRERERVSVAITANRQEKKNFLFLTLRFEAITPSMQPLPLAGTCSEKQNLIAAESARPGHMTRWAEVARENWFFFVLFFFFSLLFPFCYCCARLLFIMPQNRTGFHVEINTRSRKIKSRARRVYFVATLGFFLFRGFSFQSISFDLFRFQCLFYFHAPPPPYVPPLS